MAASRDGIDALLRDRGLRRTAARADRRVAAARGARERRARGLGGDRWTSSARGDRGRRRRPRPCGSRPSCSASSRCWRTRRCRRSRGCTPWPPRASCRRRPRPARATRSAPSGWRGAGPAAARAAAPRRRWWPPRSSTPSCATVAPFASHNGIVARAAERLVMVARGVDPTSLTVPEAGHLALRAQYESNLDRLREGGAARRARLAALRRRGLHGRAPRPARCAPADGQAAARTCERHSPESAAADTRAWLPSVHCHVAPGEPEVNALKKGRSPRGCLARVRVLSCVSPLYAEPHRREQGLHLDRSRDWSRWRRDAVSRSSRLARAAGGRRGRSRRRRPPPCPRRARPACRGCSGSRIRAPRATGRSKTRTGQPRSRATRRSSLSGFTACGWPTTSSMCTSVIESE